MVFKDWE
jgi:hypothetical protein